MSTKQAERPGSATGQSPLALSFHADHVSVAAEDGDRFFLAVQRAVEASRPAGESDAVLRERIDDDAGRRADFEREFLHPLRAWCERNAHRVRACYVPVPRGHLEAYVVGRAERYDFDLGSELSRFELELVDAGWRVHTMQIPRPDDADGLRAHFDYDGALQVYADGQPAPGEGRQEPAVPRDD